MYGHLKTLATAFAFGVATILPTNAAEDGVFRQAINYVFLGNVRGDPFPPPSSPILDYQTSISNIDRDACTVTLTYQGVRFTFFLKNFSSTTFVPAIRTLSGYALQVEGDEMIVERRWSDDRFDIHRHWAVSIHGDVERTKNALKIIFSNYCPPTKRKAPF